MSVGAEECRRGNLETPGAGEQRGHCREEGCAVRMGGGGRSRNGTEVKVSFVGSSCMNT